jgi:hypothetical protein
MKRVQMKRIAGWRKPPNTVYVGRPSKWGNPFKVTQYPLRIVLMRYEDWLRTQLRGDPNFLDELEGKDLACWCPLDKPCHVDVILKILGEKKSGINKDACPHCGGELKPSGSRLFELCCLRCHRGWNIDAKGTWHSMFTPFDEKLSAETVDYMQKQWNAKK